MVVFCSFPPFFLLTRNVCVCVSVCGVGDFLFVCKASLLLHYDHHHCPPQGVSPHIVVVAAFQIPYPPLPLVPFDHPPTSRCKLCNFVRLCGCFTLRKCKFCAAFFLVVVVFVASFTRAMPRCVPGSNRISNRSMDDGKGWGCQRNRVVSEEALKRAVGWRWKRERERESERKKTPSISFDDVVVVFYFFLCLTYGVLFFSFLFKVHTNSHTLHTHTHTCACNGGGVAFIDTQHAWEGSFFATICYRTTCPTVTNATRPRHGLSLIAPPVPGAMGGGRHTHTPARAHKHTNKE